jgi:ubiquinone/menaquinone biosynthesis C-methylase UbiE
MPYPASSFSGVIANLVLPYITHHDTIMGRVVYKIMLEQIFRVLRPGGHLIFSTPKHSVNFIYVALGSWRSFFNRQHPEYRSYALSILQHAFQIQEWGRREVYNFLPIAELESLVHETGFRDIQIKSALVGQVFVISCQKPVAESI